jgi:hypothetical protein
MFKLFRGIRRIIILRRMGIALLGLATIALVVRRLHREPAR